MKLPPAEFQAFQALWLQELGEELTPEKAEEYGERILALVALVARSKQEGNGLAMQGYQEL